MGAWLNNIIINEGLDPKQSHLVGMNTRQEWGCFLQPSACPRLSQLQPAPYRGGPVVQKEEGRRAAPSPFSRSGCTEPSTSETPSSWREQVPPWMCSQAGSARAVHSAVMDRAPGRAEARLRSGCLGRALPPGFLRRRPPGSPAPPGAYMPGAARRRSAVAAGRRRPPPRAQSLPVRGEESNALGSQR